METVYQQPHIRQRVAMITQCAGHSIVNHAQCGTVYQHSCTQCMWEMLAMGEVCCGLHAHVHCSGGMGRIQHFFGA